MYNVKTLGDTLSRTISQQRINAALLALFAATALLLSALGLYGVTSQFVSARRRELGVRMALGARPAHIVASVTAPIATTTVVGIAAGVAGALALARVMTTLVFGISAYDTWSFVAAPVLLGVVAALTASIPARRAATIDQMHALRDE